MKTEGSSQTMLQAGLALILWLLSIVLGALSIVAVREIALFLFTEFVVRDRTAAYFYSQSVTLLNSVTVLLAIVLVVYVVGSGEYHLKRFGQRSSWRLFAWALGVELVLVLLGYLV